jgi:transcriptional regulator with XRE-family HTH domain
MNLMQSTVNQRFAFWLDFIKLNQKQFCETTGLLPATISNIANGRTEQPKSDFFEALLKYFPELNLRWLLLGEEPMLSTMENMHTLREPDGPGYAKQDGELLALVKQLTEMLAEEQRSRRALEEKMGKLETELLVLQRQVKTIGEAVDRK